MRIRRQRKGVKYEVHFDTQQYPNRGWGLMVSCRKEGCSWTSEWFPFRDRVQAYARFQQICDDFDGFLLEQRL